MIDIDIQLRPNQTMLGRVEAPPRDQGADMSFSLAVWFAPATMSAADAATTRTDVPSLDDVAEAFTGFATGDTTWRTGFEWRKLDF
ncbi:hypothetical protein ACWEOE_33995 [Amycolatopsis sp. NPDC004368]